jgi:hypothetical protein
MLRNPVIRDGYVSSEPIGSHTGFAPRKTDDARLRNTLPTRTCRPRSAPSWIRTARVSDAIGWHPRPETPDVNDTAAMHFEAQFAHRFGEAGHLGAVLSTKGTGAAAEFQKRFIERAAAMQPTNEFEFDETEGKTVRDDGQVCAGRWLVARSRRRCRLTRGRHLCARRPSMPSRSRQRRTRTLTRAGRPVRAPAAHGEDGV